LATESDLFVFSDAAALEEDYTGVHQTRCLINEISGFKSVTVIEREKNLGLAASIISGVTDLIGRFGRVIVLEDDLETSPNFLQFMNSALSYYAENEEVMHISGYMFPVDSKELPTTFFLRPTTCWGWGTWASSWRYFVKDADFYIKTFTKKMIADFNLQHSNPYFSHLIANKRGELNTWAIFWYASCFLRGGLSLHPRDSFVHNIGMDSSGVHCNATDKYDVELVRDASVEFSSNLILESAACRALEEFYIRTNKFSIKRFLSRQVSKFV